MSDKDDRFLARTMLRLNGEICTPPYIAGTDVYKEIKARKLMEFCEWPSGHWRITDIGRNFLDGVKWEE